MLDIAADYLSARGIRYVKFTGSLSSKKKDEVLSLFKETGPEAPTVMLISTTAGGGEQSSV
jgi:SNF2 family DNA or RNA helicase